MRAAEALNASLPAAQPARTLRANAAVFVPSSATAIALGPSSSRSVRILDNGRTLQSAGLPASCFMHRLPSRVTCDGCRLHDLECDFPLAMQVQRAPANKGGSSPHPTDRRPLQPVQAPVERSRVG
jgi:hypothetical protein